MNHYSYSFPVGRLWIAAEGDAITAIGYAPVGGAELETPVIARAARQLEEYFAGRRTRFDVPLDLRGTDFQRRVWDALLAIPFGEVSTYGQIAAAVGSPRGSRAVGMACNRNPVSIVVPCHRVVGSTGSLTGYAGGLDKKEILLGLEAGAAAKSSPVTVA